MIARHCADAAVGCHCRAAGAAAHFDLSVIHPTTGELVATVNLLSVAGLHKILTGLVTNFTGFAPLGTVLVALIGIGVAEHSGLIGWALLFAAWIALGWPVGPGAPLHYLSATH